MKRFWILILCLLLLCGCTQQMEEPTEEPETTAPTEPPKPWTEELGVPWDREGTLIEIPLTVPDGLHYTSLVGFDGDLLLWSVDDHLEGTSILEMCLIELDDGSVKAQKDFAFDRTVVPRVLDDRIYLGDTSSGRIIALDSCLNQVGSWTTEPEEATWFMGADGTLYAYGWENGLTVRNLAGGEAPELPALGELVSNFYSSGHMARMEYYDPNTGSPSCAFVNLRTGETEIPAVDLQYDTVDIYGDSWLFGKYGESHTYYLHSAGQLRSVQTGQDLMSFLPEGLILRTSEETGYLYLYDLSGAAVSVCRISEVPYTYTPDEFIWNPALNGYFIVAGNYGGDQRLLFWDTGKGGAGEPLALEEIPDISEQESQVRQRVAQLEETYGVTIFVGKDCDTVFDEFYATQTEDWTLVNDALDTLDRAFSAYPEGFLRQLRYGDVRGIRIHLISDLQADGSGRYGGGYNAFAQEHWDHNLMVMDITDTYVNTYHHEITHIIDNYLTWDAMNREDAVFSEEQWNDLNPKWFTGYSYDYSQEHKLKDDESFVDGYATIKPTEDRARIMEYAMQEGCEWLFEDAEVLLNKLEYYSKCIRDAFNTEGWPDELLWEEYLDLME